MFWIILLMPVVSSKFTVNIVGSWEPKVEFSGSDTAIISDAERGLFRIKDKELKRALFNFLRARPDDVFVRSPTPWNDLYKVYKVPEVTRTLVIRAAEIISRESQNTILSSKNIENKDEASNTFNVQIPKPDNTVRHVWPQIFNVTIHEKLNYNVSAAVNGTIRFSCENGFFEDEVNTISNTDSKPFVNITLKAGQTAVAVLIAFKEVIKVKVEYEVSLDGDVFANYEGPYKGEHFKSAHVNDVLDHNGLPKIISWVEFVTITSYGGESILVFDLNGNEIK